jgi:anti-sigma factor RsiW
MGEVWRRCASGWEVRKTRGWAGWDELGAEGLYTGGAEGALSPAPAPRRNQRRCSARRPPNRTAHGGSPAPIKPVVRARLRQVARTKLGVGGSVASLPSPISPVIKTELAFGRSRGPNRAVGAPWASKRKIPSKFQLTSPGKEALARLQRGSAEGPLVLI